MSEQIATANRLSDGLVVFLGVDGEWSTSIDVARVAECEDDLSDLLQEAEASADVVGAYLIDVEVRTVEAASRAIEPLKYRERIRAFGPSTHPAFAKKKVPGHFDAGHDVSAVFMNGI